jgi:hypothetical protein
MSGTATPAEKLTIPMPSAEHFVPVLEEVRAFGTDFHDVLRPAFMDYRNATQEPLVAAERRIMESAMKMEELCHELAVVAPDLIRAARRDHPLTIANIDFNDSSGREMPWTP